MTIDEAIQHCEEVAIREKSAADGCRYWTDGMGEETAKKCEKCAEEHQQLAEWLKELKAHRKAWEKAKRTVRAYLILEEFGRGYQDDIEKLIEECKPKEGNAE